ncbi:MAG: hypothetical protein LBR29_08870, partial [Methylobacteriaceae bacterium]|nr:hypothetical protein [Methylobacteriaceae bacterium]
RCRDIAAEGEALRAVEGVVSDEERRALREKRNTAWAVHKRALTLGTAEAFEAVLNEDDEVTERVLKSADSAAKLTRVQHDRFVEERKLEDCRRALAEAEARQAALIAETGARLARVAPGFGGLNDWPRVTAALRRHGEAAALAGRRREAAATLAELHAAEAALFTDAAAVFAAVGLEPPAPGDWETCFARGEAFRQEVQELAETGRLRDAAVAAATERRRAFDACVTDYETAKTLWREAQRGTWLMGADGPRPPEDVAVVLDERLPQLEQRVTERNSLLRRIRDMEADRESFAKAVADIAAALDTPVAGKSSGAVWQDLRGRIRDAVAARRKCEELGGNLAEEHERLAQVKREIDSLEATKQLILAAVPVDSLDAARVRLEALQQRKTLQRQVLEAEREALQALGGDDTAALAAVLDPLNRAALEGEIRVAEARVIEAQAARQERYAELKSAGQAEAAVAGDASAVALRTRYQTVALELSAGAEEYFKLAAGLLAAERALGLYRDTHRGPMMLEASRIFADMSGGNYRELTTQPDEKHNDILIAVSAAGASRRVEELSDGARAQLYLALRMAGFHEFIKTRSPVPFLADDILEPFDDHRAAATFTHLARMAEHGQVIYLTHHRHLVDLAHRTVPGARIHELEKKG